MDYFFPGQCYETVVTDRAADGMLYHARDHAHSFPHILSLLLQQNAL